MENIKIIDRIKKLLSLATSANQHEAAQAAALAADLMLKHEIEEAALAPAEAAPEAVEESVLDELGRQHVSWRGIIAAGLSKAHGCACYGTKEKGIAQTRVVGQPSKVATIRYMYAYLTSETDRLADVAYRDEVLECRKSDVPAPSARGWKNGFRVGCAAEISKRLTAQRKETHAAARIAGQSSALVVVADAERAVERHMRREHPRLRSSSVRTSSRSGVSAGRAAGGNVSLGGGRALGRGAHQLGN
jgi:hypothetical protein